VKYQNDNGKVGLALLSFAHFHQYRWIEAFEADERADIIGFWDDNPVRGKDVEKETGIRLFNDLDRLLEHHDVCAAAICSETSKHRFLIERCCSFKLPVMCEKPTARNAAEAESIAELVRTAGIPYLQVFPQRLMTGNIRIKEILDSGMLGRVTHVRKRHGHGFGLETLATDMPWIVDAAESGGGAYIDEGVHETDLLCHYFGMPLSVCAQKSNMRCGDGEMAATALFEFPNELTVVHEAGWNWIAGGPTTEIYGEEGVLIESLTDCASSTGNSLLPHLALFRKETGQWETLEENYDFSVVHHMFPPAFLDMLIDSHPPIATLEDGLNAVRIVDGVYRSINERRTIQYHLEKEST
jgi:myo-inositol 2-dehydrogenase / D-chiro-inositol 1-dehydrogenase